LKRRQKGVFRELPLPDGLRDLLEGAHSITLRRADAILIDKRLWPWSRTTAWALTKAVMQRAGLPEYLCQPKALRHTFGIEGVMNQNIPLGVMQKWMGHARIDSTVVYTTPVGREERALAHRMWSAE